MSSLRLVCPGCGAQYDVPLTVIPPDGRDVQCASCGETWFEPHPEQAAAPMAAYPPEETLGAGDDEPGVQAAQARGIDSRPERDDAPPDGQDWWTDLDEPAEADAALPDDEPEPAPVQPVRPRSIDPAMAALFQEEREHEAQLRRAQAEPMESQPDLGLEAPPLARYDRRPARTAGRAQAQGLQQGQDVRQAQDEGQARNERQTGNRNGFDGPGTQSRRDRLPSIDDVNDSLRDDTDRRLASQSRPAPEDFDLDEPEGRSGFGLGFVLPLLLAGLVVGAYVGAPAITEQVPDAAPLLDRYADAVDTGRLWLSRQADDLRTLIETF